MVMTDSAAAGTARGWITANCAGDGKLWALPMQTGETAQKQPANSPEPGCEPPLISALKRVSIPNHPSNISEIRNGACSFA